MAGNTDTDREQTGKSASREDSLIFRRSVALAEEIAGFLENHGIQCRITIPEDIMRGQPGDTVTHTDKCRGSHEEGQSGEPDRGRNGAPDPKDCPEGFPLIVSGKGKAILPMGICADNAADASAARKMAEKTLSVHCPATGGRSSGTERPIILSEDRWRGREGDCIRKRLLAHFGIFRHVFARNCEVRRLPKDMAREFLDAYHSYGHTVCRYSYGLFLKKAAESRHTSFPAESATGHPAEGMSPTAGNPAGDPKSSALPAGTLVAVATFSNGRLMPRNGKVYRSYQWIRYASLPDMRVSGGMGKMLKYFISETDMHGKQRQDGTVPDNYGGRDIMSYADLEWSGGDVYGRLGFIAEDTKSPVMYCISPKDWQRMPVSRMKSHENADDTAGTAAPASLQSGYPYFENFGSTRYRLVIPETKCP